MRKFFTHFLFFVIPCPSGQAGLLTIPYFFFFKLPLLVERVGERLSILSQKAKTPQICFLFRVRSVPKWFRGWLPKLLSHN